LPRLEVTLSKALKYVDGDIYLLSIIVAKRAEQISNGAEPLLTNEIQREYKPTDIALIELSEGLLEYEVS
jgi:DNA-directed RNA polymerase subunit omega